MEHHAVHVRETEASLQRRLIQTKDGLRAIRTFNTAKGEWRLMALGKRYFSDHEGQPEHVIRIPAAFDVYRSGRRNAQYEGWFPYELLEMEMRQRLQALRRAGAPQRRADSWAQGKSSRYDQFPTGRPWADCLTL